MNSKTKSSAHVADQHLVLSLMTAIEPVVWRRSLADIGSATFETRKVPKKEHYKLILKPQSGTAETVATFENREEAIGVLQQAAAALQHGSAPADTAATASASQTNMAAAPASNQKRGGGLKWLWVVVFALVIVVLFFVLASLIPERVTGFENSDGTVQQTAPAGQPPSAQTGVPLSADDFLSGAQ